MTHFDLETFDLNKWLYEHTEDVIDMWTKEEFDEEQNIYQYIIKF